MHRPYFRFSKTDVRLVKVRCELDSISANYTPEVGGLALFQLEIEYVRQAHALADIRVPV